ncbi:MAG: TIGR02099 family protein [Betaproteobacteria bacterium RIFCSPLOWO2_12_FULL_68_20]|nr:MAG: TIGR02099 family protein [Betaproteobacteria bacterium RIFCSPLOWO2_12_FULL_68_20]
MPTHFVSADLERRLGRLAARAAPWLRALEVAAWAGFFVFAALVLALRFWLLPNVERYREDIVAAISRSIGQPVRIGAIEAGWLGLRPKLSLSDVRVYDAEGREALALPSVENVIAWRSLLTLDLRLHSLAIDGPKLAVRRDSSGGLHVAGMKLSDEAGEARFTDWVLGQTEIVIRGAEIEWRDEKRGAPPLALSGLEFRLRNDGDRHSFGLTARPPAALGSTLELRAVLDGRSVTDIAKWNGRVFAELGYTDLAGWRQWIDYPVDVRRGQGALRAWATLGDGMLTQATADVELARVSARLGKDLPVLELASVRGRIQERLTRSGYELAGRGFALAAEGAPPMDPANFRVSWQPGAPERGSVIANVIELEPLARLSEFLPLPPELRKLLAELQPRGSLLDARLDWSGPLAEPARYTARARFSELAMNAWRNVPGFAGLSGSVEASADRGTVYLAARDAEVDLPKVFPEPRIRLESLSGQVDWERSGKALSVRLASIGFANEHLAGSAYGTYAYAENGPGAIDLSAQLSRADGRHVAKYLPSSSILGPETRAWLASSVLAGQASDARLRLRGDLRDFPFVDPAKGQFTVSARVTGGVLDYANGWPRIDDIDAELLFDRNRMEIAGRSGAILGAKLASVRASIPDLLAPVTILTITGQAEGPSGDFLKYIRESPVRQATAGITDAMSAEGRGRLRLRLDLPLEELHKTRAAGDFQFSNNTVTVNPQLPPVERASGKLSFTEGSFSLQEARGRMFGGPVTISGGSKAGSAIEVVASGEATAAGVQQVLEHPWQRQISGSAPYVATLGVRGGRAQITVESSLRGLASTLPPPLAKAASDALPLRIDVLPAESGKRDRVSVTLGRIAAAEFLRQLDGEAMVTQRAALWLSPQPGESVRVPERPGTLVYGALASLDLDRWLPLVSGEGGAPGAASFDLRVGTLDAFGKRMHDVALRAGTDGAGWSASVKAEELAGEISYRGEKGGQLIARLEHFRIPDPYPGAKGAESGEAREFPSVDLIAERFTFRGKPLGRVEIVAQRAGADWRIDRLAMVNPDAALRGKGLWRTGGASLTSLEFELEAADAGKFLDRVGYAELVKGGKAKLSGSLAWAGDPATLDIASLSGDLQLQAEDGQFVEIEPGVGKLVSLMSMQMLPRRITLDFRDVFSKGFQFDRVTSSLHVKQGVASTSDFRMRGPAAEVEMSGEADLARETQKLRVRVVPSIGDSAATVVGLVNPIAGFATMLAQRVLKNPLGQIFAFEYSVTGTWADPKVKKLAGPPPVPEAPADGKAPAEKPAQ